MSRPLLKIAMVGHVDHGKSTLIGRLLLDTHSLPDGKMKEIKRLSRELGKEAELAYLTDQFREERENDMTIDTTQVFFKTRRAHYAIIDSPGHVEFIKNMLTGATQADAAILIVDVL
jgi:sulfate adenylyltransferase subunit 1 (EFTu-like GTPase family)